MNKSIEIKNIIVLLLLLCIGMQAKAQQAVLVDVFREDFERPEFTGDYILPLPGSLGFNFHDFTYTTDGSLGDNQCVITKNANQNGFWDPVPDNSGTGYYLYAKKESGTNHKIIYSKDVTVRKGEIVEFGVYYCALENGYNFEIQATGSGVDNKTITTSNFPSPDTVWKHYSLTIRATDDGTVTFSVVDKYGYGNNAHTFGIDDITISKKAVQVANPTSLVMLGTNVPLEAEYNNPFRDSDESYSYKWQIFNGTSWDDATGTGAVGSGTGNAFITNAFTVTESTAGFYNYRLVVTAGSDTYYSDIITVEYTSTSYIFREDFGGNFTSTASTTAGSSEGSSADWWIMPGDQPSIETDFTYGPFDNDGDNRGLAEIAYGQKVIKLDNNDAATYAITKIAGWELPLPNESSKTWKWGDTETGNGKGGFDDHTIPNDNTRGYFMYSVNRLSTEKTVYKTTIPAIGMAGKAFKLSAWQVALWGNSNNFSYQFKLEVLNASNTVIKAESFKVTDDWQEKSLSFYLPTDYTGGDITLRISSLGDNLWLGLDDISLVEEEIRLDIISPESGSTVGTATNFVVNYKHFSSSLIYKWQYSANGSTGWTDINGVSGSLNSSNGTFITEVPVAAGGHYRVLMTDGDDTNYTKAIPSGTVMLNKSADYYFIEDFGGAATSTSTTKDWWKTQEEGAAAKLPQLYGSDYLYTEDVDWIEVADKANHPHGMDKTLYLFNDRFAITKVSGKMATVKYEDDKTIPIMLDGQKTVFDHTTATEATGYYMLTRGWGNGKTVYAHTHNHLPAGNYIYKVWLAGASTDPNNLINVELRVKVGSKTVTLPVTITNQGWTEYTLPFYTDGSATTISIVQVGNHEGNAIFGIDDIMIGNPVPRIAIPDADEVCVLEGESITLTGEYKYVAALGSGNVTYTWEKSTNGTSGWAPVGTSTGANTDKGDAPTGAPTYITGNIDREVHYRFIVSGNGIELTSNSIKITPSEWPKERTYWVCPDNITQGEIDGYGYLPSLIDLAMPDLYVIYKWYETETDGTPLEDKDDYQIGQKRDETIVYTSDGKTNTISMVNDRSTEGKFDDRTYWVEVCHIDGTPYSDVKRIPVSVRKAYICASLDPVVSKDNSRLINREDFGGTEDSAPDILQTSPSHINVDYEFYTADDNNLEQGGYMIAKKSPTLSNYSWFAMEDHVYDYDNGKHGYLFVANATDVPGRFYTHQLTDLGSCRNLELTFSGWFASPVKWAGSEKANLKFVLTDSDFGDVLAEFTTGNLIDIEGKWRQYGFKFFVPEGVTNITLEIINNNFGTTGGNDMVMDDIEIYLNIPPITLVPSGDSYVCPNSTEVSLKGSYEDDGTLGKKLDYRWEYRKNSNNSWGVVPNKWGSVSNGIVTPTKSEYFIEQFEEKDNGEYRLVVGQEGVFGNDFKKTPNYDCVAVSESRNLTLITASSDIPEPSLEGPTAFCFDEKVEIFNKELNEEVQAYHQYVWQLDGKTIEKSPEDYNGEIGLKKVLNAADYTPGFYTITLIVYNSVGCSYYSMHEFVIYPEKTTWIAEGKTNNWNDGANWDNGVPGDCTDVIIPNKSMSLAEGVSLLPHYPLLIKPNVETLNEKTYTENQKNLNNQRDAINDENVFSLRPACDNILFKMGGSVARTDYLNYTAAAVDLDIKPARWYTLSAPLRDMYSGDYFVEGNVKRMKPTVFMMKYNTMNPQTKEEAIAGQFSNPFNTLTEDLYPGLGFAVWVDEDGKKDELQPFRFPKDSTQYAMWNYHGIYLGKTKTLSRDNIGRFIYEKHITMNGNLPVASTTGFEVEVKDDKETYTTMMVGNPFMGYLDFAAFRTANPGIADGYYIWTSGETFEATLPGDFNDNGVNAIAPMQSFIVKKTGKFTKLNFTFEMSVTAPASDVMLRSAATRAAAPSILKLEVLRDGMVQSNIRIKYNPEEKNEYSAHKDMWTLFSADVTHPAVLYTLLDGKAASIRTLGDLSKPIELGIRTNAFGTLTLRVSGTETLDPTCDIYLEDRLTGISHNLREGPEYTFSNQTGNVQGRFYLRMGDAITGVEDVEPSESDIQVVTNKRQIVITSSAADPIEQVKVYSLQGQLLYEQQSIGQSTYAVNMPLKNQMVIVVVNTSEFQKRTKVVVQ